MNFMPTSNIPNHVPRHIIGLSPLKNKKIEMVRKYSKALKIFAFILAFFILINPTVTKITFPFFNKIYGSSKKSVSVDYIIQPLSASNIVMLNSIIQDPAIRAEHNLVVVVPQPQIQEAKIGVSDDKRVNAIYKYLKENNSPMIGNALDFVSAADTYGLDWRLIVSISGAESGFGKIIPLSSSGGLSYNGWGWGGAGNYAYFSSWKDAITKISRGISKTYGTHTTPRGMEPVYCPPCVGDHHWANTVNSIMSDLSSLDK